MAFLFGKVRRPCSSNWKMKERPFKPFSRPNAPMSKALLILASTTSIRSLRSPWTVSGRMRRLCEVSSAEERRGRFYFMH
jgi:hypothetical protein